MNKNILYCTLGIIAGFFLGFFVANAMGGFGVATTTTANAPASASSATNTAAARPLKPSETELPSNHPDIGDAASGGDTPPATSQQAQKAKADADRNPRDFDAQMSAAAAFHQLEAFDQTATYLERALAIRPKDTDALVALGNTKYDSGDFAGAASFYERALAIQPANPDVRTDLGNTYFQRKPPDYARAIAEYRKSIAIDAQHEKSWQNMAAAAVRLRDKATAREAVERLASINPQSAALESLRRSVESLP
ncbi:MAG TPA: tetratricopeptide repeat protein [Pyrinomonadaceae bacterium]